MLWLRKTFWSIAVSLDTVQQPLTKTIQVSTVLLATHFAPRWRSIKMKLFFFFLPGQQSTPIVIQDSLPCTYIEETMRLLSRCRWRQQLVDIHTPSALKSLCDSLSTATATLDSQGSGTSMSIPSRAGVICSSTTGNVCKGSPPPLSLKSCGGHC